MRLPSSTGRGARLAPRCSRTTNSSTGSCCGHSTTFECSPPRTSGAKHACLPAIRAAFEWMDIFGDPKGDGYLSYEKRSAKGLVNQGWKDSWDAVVHANGTLAQPPIALSEVQGYAYAARHRLAPVLERLGETKLTTRLRRDARRVYQRFNDDF